MQIKVFSAAFLGKVVAAIFLAACTLFGFGPDKWVAFLLNDLPTYVTPAIARVTLVVLAVLTALGLWKTWHPSPKSGPSIVPARKRISMIDLAVEAEKRGWKLLDPNSLQTLDLLDGVRQLGLDGNVQLYGRLVHSFPQLTQQEPLVPIPKDVWRTHRIPAFDLLRFNNDGTPSAFRTDNLEVQIVMSDLSEASARYADIHLDREGALAWLDSGALEHRGKRDAQEQKQQTRQRVRLSEAVVQAYEQTQGTLASEAAERLASGDVEGWYAAAITKDRDVTVYGRKPPSRVHVEVPQEHLQSYMFMAKANELVDQFDDKKRYVDLEISAADAERRIAVIKAWH